MNLQTNADFDYVIEQNKSDKKIEIIVREIQGILVASSSFSLLYLFNNSLLQMLLRLRRPSPYNRYVSFRFVSFRFVLFCFVLFCFVLFCFVLFCFVLFCFVLFCFVLFCFVLFCFVLFILYFLCDCIS